MTVPTSIASDAPESDSGKDLLGYAPFAKALASAISEATKGPSLVIALHGEWGVGKSTVLKFVKAELAKAPGLLVLDFNPWWFAGREDLLRQLFSLLAVNLRKNRFWFFKGGRELLKYATALEVGGVAYNIPNSSKDPASVKRKAEKYLTKHKQRVVVFIDDVDRLSAEEVRELFAAIKAVADFPNVIYVMAFDRGVVASVLEGVQGGTGDDYLEKIVQAAFQVPKPSPEALEAMLVSRLNQTLGDLRETSFDITEWRNLFIPGIKPLLKTPRDVVRYANFVGVTYPSVKGEVHVIDFLALEALRVFVPAVHEVLRESPEQFTGVNSSRSYGGSDDELKKFHEGWVKELALPPETEAACKHVLQTVFPRTKSVWSNWGIGRDYLRPWRKDLRAASPDIFPAYFALAPPPSTLSQADVKQMLAATADRGQLRGLLTSWATAEVPNRHNKASLAISRLLDHAERDVPKAHIMATMGALFDVAEQLEQAKGSPAGMFGPQVQEDLRYVLAELLLRLEKSTRDSAVRKAAEPSDNVGLFVRFVDIAHAEHEEREGRSLRREEDRLFSAAQLPPLAKMAIARIRKAAQDGKLATAKDFRYLLDYWWRHGKKADVKTWVATFTATDRGLLDFLSSHVSTGSSAQIGDAAGRTYRQLRAKSVEGFVNLEEVNKRCITLSRSKDLSEEDRDVVRMFLQGYKLHKEGKDPDGPFAILGDEGEE